MAWLHEALELTSVSERELIMDGLTDDELRALRLLSRIADSRSEVAYFGHLERIARAGGTSGWLARQVKRADLTDRCRHPHVRRDGWSPPYERALAWMEQTSRTDAVARPRSPARSASAEEPAPAFAGARPVGQAVEHDLDRRPPVGLLVLVADRMDVVRRLRRLDDGLCQPPDAGARQSRARTPADEQSPRRCCARPIVCVPSSPPCPSPGSCRRAPPGRRRARGPLTRPSSSCRVACSPGRPTSRSTSRRCRTGSAASRPTRSCGVYGS